MKIQFNIFILFQFMLFAVAGNAQSDSTINKEVEVIKAYQPSISEAFKISTNPLINDTITYTPTFEYQIFSKDVPIEKNINHLPVVTLGNPPQVKPETGYVKAGFGNALTPYGELLINATPTKNTDFGLQLFHFYSRPNIKLNNQLKLKAPYSNSLGRIFMKSYFRKAVMDWDLNFQRQGLSYFGFPLTDTTAYRQNEAVIGNLNEKQILNTASTFFNLKNTNARAKLDYNIGLGYDYFWNSTGQTAHHAEYTGLFAHQYRNFQVMADSKFEYFLHDSILHNLENTITNHQFFHVALAPQIKINKEVYEAKAGFNLSTMLHADSSMLWHISPKIYFAYHPIKGILTLFAGSDGGFSPNNYQQMFSQNQYIDYTTDMKPTQKVIGLYGGFKGKMSRKLSYLFDVNYNICKNEVIYYLNQVDINGNILIDNLFKTDYDDINTLKFGGNIRYSSSGFMLELKGNYYSYNAKNINTILSYRPDFDATLSTSIPITKRINTTLNASLIGPRKAYIVSEKTVVTPASTIYSQEVINYNLPTIIDLNLGAEYSYSKNISFFCNAQNLLNQNYELWQGYNHQGILILLGGHYTF